jgi:hypothetical protein
LNGHVPETADADNDTVLSALSCGSARLIA